MLCVFFLGYNDLKRVVLINVGVPVCLESLFTFSKRALYKIHIGQIA